MIGSPNYAELTAQDAPPHRLLVLTDIEADPDDTQSLIRLLLYANEIEIVGLVATTSTWLRDTIRPESIEKILATYAEVHPNLVKHDPAYPTAESLRAKVYRGLPVYGMMGVGEGKDSEGSDRIIELLEEDDRPLWVSVWGGINTLAQALYTIDQTRSKEEAARLISKLRVYTISDQDDSGPWIRKEFPDVFYVFSYGDYGRATWIAINNVIDGIDNTTISNAWLSEHIQQGHGPLGAAYPDVAWGMEGDTPAWLSLIPNGLNAPERPDWGGWGGRYESYVPEFDASEKGAPGVPYTAETRPVWTDASDAYTPYVKSEYGRSVKRGEETFEGSKVTLWRWRDDFQNDFAARMDWTTQSVADANHAPTAVCHPEELTVRSGEGFRLDAAASTDPDGDHLTYSWQHYPEAGSYAETIDITPENSASVWVTAPEVEQEETAHFILKVTDHGAPALTSYRRVVVTILAE
ncbi:hypothetical protein GGR28_002254 [Lewinella aquimaris]|uniref:DUF1593 domain-containing protein n=1 Tax=Neolewinella aquimaris TaxID=1835722 RepID=A0A840ECV4_9BACT|nr:DUF1593 domain-containing protein [Neolewinella aquimaris]MBB4079629.1 hypothetical protein [Neolewinella aquimaris]